MKYKNYTIDYIEISIDNLIKLSITAYENKIIMIDLTILNQNNEYLKFIIDNLLIKHQNYNFDKIGYNVVINNHINNKLVHESINIFIYILKINLKK